MNGASRACCEPRDIVPASKAVGLAVAMAEEGPIYGMTYKITTMTGFDGMTYVWP